MQPPSDLTVSQLGPRRVASPLGLSTVPGDYVADFTPEGARVMWDPGGKHPDVFFERAGPRESLFFRGPEVSAGIVTCGGLCPGMNDVVRGLVLQLWHNYGVRRILGFRYGYRGMVPSSPAHPIPLDPDVVEPIHLQGGTVLGSSRGPRDPVEIVDNLQRLDVDMVFCIGGDGTMLGAAAIAQELARRAAPIALVGVPKTIDNDLPYVERSFGFDTAVAVATEAIRAAHVEARGAPDGVGLVKLMGRHAGFIAAHAALASGDVNLVLVPEVPFELDGSQGLVAWLHQRLDRRGHAVVTVAEGAGQELLDAAGSDASGNPLLGDIGLFLKDRIAREIKPRGGTVKYIDPSYIIRATPADPADAVFCGQLAENAVHAAMAGKTAVVVGYWCDRFTHVPLAALNAATKRLEPDGPLWRNVVERTGQPLLLGRLRSAPGE